MTNILHIALNFNQNSGITTYVSMLFRHFLQKPKYKLHFITNGGNAVDKLESIGVHPAVIPMQTGIQNIFHLRSNLQFIKKYCKEHKIQIIHTHHRYPEFVSSLIAKKYQLRTITTAHSLVHGQKMLSFKSDKIIAVSNTVRESITQRYGVDKTKIETMYNCIEEMPDFFTSDILSLRKTVGIPSQNKVILYIGRFDTIKGTKYLIDAFERIRHDFNNITLLMVGDPHCFSQKTSNWENGCQQIILPPQINGNQYFHLADLVVLPSLQDPFPYVMLEAGMAKKAFVGSKVDGIAEFIEDGKDGLLFNAGDVKKLIECIVELLNNPITPDFLGNNLYQKVKSLPTCEQYCDKLGEIYQNLLNS
ncbi:MAG: glycosyltransferase family 4 protein [Bacteroidota bacterium]